MICWIGAFDFEIGSGLRLSDSDLSVLVAYFVVCDVLEVRSRMTFTFYDVYVLLIYEIAVIDAKDVCFWVFVSVQFV